MIILISIVSISVIISGFVLDYFKELFLRKLIIKDNIIKYKNKKSIKLISMITKLLLMLLFLLIFKHTPHPPLAILYCIFTSALLLLSIIDLLTYEIPIQINYFIGILGIVRILTDPANLMSYLIGFFCISGFLYIIYVLTKGKGIGGGDIKLMAVSGLVVGFPNIVVAFLIGCILGSVIHTIRCKVSKADHVLAFGPYLSAGLVISILFGEKIIQWYVSLF